jgi:hypothetical protein
MRERMRESIFERTHCNSMKTSIVAGTDAGSIEQGPVMLLVTRAAPMFIWSTSILKPGKYFEMFTLGGLEEPEDDQTCL